MLGQRLHVSLMIHQQKHIKSLRKKEQEGVPAVAQGCGTGTPAVSLEFWDTGLTPRLAQWIGDLVLLQVPHRSKLRLRSDPWLGLRVAKKRKKIK